MSLEQIIGLALSLLVMGVGVVGCVLPGLPGPPLILAAALAHRLYFGPAGVGNLVLGLLAGLTVLAVLLEYLATLLGAKHLGATWRGILGAALGGVVGLFFPLPGIVLGPFLGATLLEYLGGRELQAASRAGLGALLGLLAGVVGKVACSLAMIGLFILNVIWRS